MVDTLPLALYKKTNTYTEVIDKNISFLAPFFGKPGSYDMISLSDVITASKLDLIANFAGKYIFI